MRSKGTETGDTLEGDPPEDEGSVSSSVPSGGVSHWTPQQSNIPICPSTSDMLYVNLEESCPSSPPFLERDPNMSSTARYSPIQSAPPNPQTHPAPGIMPPYTPPNGPAQQGPPHLDQQTQHFMQYNTLNSERMGALLQVMEADVSGEQSVNVVEGDAHPSYFPTLTAPGVSTESNASDSYGVSSSSALYMPPPHHTTHLMDTADLQLVLAANGEYHMIDGSGIKAEQVELLITGGQSGISYSLSSENGFIVARPTMATGSNIKTKSVVSETNSMAVDVSILDSLNESSHFDEDQSIVMDSETLDSTNLHFSQQDELILPSNSSGDISPSQLEEVECGGMVDLEDIAEYLDSPDNEADVSGARSRRRQYDNDDNTITCIPDKSVPCRARASLPAAHLWFGAGGSTSVRGVFARRRIPTRARFGPLEGCRRRLARPPPSPTDPTQVKFLLHTSGGNYAFDISDERTSNWMRYVRFEPGPLQNVCLQQSGNELYFISCRPIAPRQELILGYGSAYARQWGLPPPPLHTTDNDEMTLEWPCYECSLRFASSPELQAHLNMHDEEENKSPINRKPKKKPQKNITSEHICTVCNKTFPRIFSLKRHMLTHKQNNILDETPLKNNINNDGFNDSNSHYSPRGESLRNSFESQDSLKEHSNELMAVSGVIKPLVSMVVENDHSVLQHTIKRETHIEQEQEQLVPDSQMDQESMDSACGEMNADDCYEMGQDENTSFKSNIEMLTCNICNKLMTTQLQYESHMRAHELGELKPVPCPACPMDVTESTAVNKKETADTNGVVPTSTTDNSVKPASEKQKSGPGVLPVGIQCFICPRTFKHGGLLKEHLQDQHRRSDGKYDCPLCDVVLVDYKTIKKHILGFHAVRRFSCHQCGNNFSSSDKLRLHMLRHSDRRDFVCVDCGKQFKRRDKLKDHMKKQHSGNESSKPAKAGKTSSAMSTTDPTAYLKFTFKCHPCKLGFKRRGMLVNHLARRHPEVVRATVPELQLPILRVARNYYCQHCDKVYKSSSKRKAHIIKNHPGESIPPSSRGSGSPQNNMETATSGNIGEGYSACVGAVPSSPHLCPHQPCHKQYASKAKLLQHIRLKHPPQAGNIDSKENNHLKLNKDAPNHESVSKNNVSDNSQVSDDCHQRNIFTHTKIIKHNKNPFLSHNIEDNKKSFSQQNKPKTSSAPWIHPTGTNQKWDGKILTGLLNANYPTLTSDPKPPQMDSMNVAKPLSEVKFGGFMAGSPKQSTTAPKNIWKSDSDPSFLIDSLRNGNTRLRLIQLSDGVQILDDADSIQIDQTIKNMHSVKFTMDDVNRIHGPGTVTNIMDGNKLPPMSVLAGNSVKSRYTDR